MGIKEIKVRAFRGIRNEVIIPLDGKSILIHGDNGTGKSSIETALRWALVGKPQPSSEQAFSSQASLLRHILEPVTAPSVKVTLVDDSTVEVSASTGHSRTGIGPEFCEACVKGSPFLKRAELLNVLNDRPVDRFKYLEGFLDLQEADQAREALATRSQELQARALKSRASRDQILVAIKKHLPAEYSEMAVGEDGLRKALAMYAASLKLTGGEVLSWDQLEQLALQSQPLAVEDGLAKVRVALASAINEIKKCSNEFGVLALAPLEAEDQRCRELASKTADSSIAELINHAIKHVASEHPDVCPVCRQTIDADNLAAQLQERQNHLKSYQDATRAYKLQLHKWAQLTGGIERLQNAINAALSEAILKEAPSAPQGIELATQLSHGSQEKLGAALIAIGTSTLLEWYSSYLIWAEGAAKKRTDSLPPEGSGLHVKALINAVKAGKAAAQQLLKLEQEASQLESQSLKVAKVVDAIRLARQDVAKSLFSTLGNTVADYYALIHPPDDESEKTSPPSLTLQRHQGGIAIIRGGFAGTTVDDPRWIYSDGHLDTVGICIFLALRRFRADRHGDARLMVLDDIVLSIDLPHTRRLIQLLQSKFKDHQIIILTHNGLFAHWCGDLMPGLRRIQILKWTLEAGPMIGDHKTAIERLQKHLEGGSPKDIAGGVRDLLDEFLLECRFEYQLSIPARRGEQYTLTDIWEQFAKVIRECEKKLGTKIGESVQLLDELRDLPRIRNYLSAHENEFAREFPLATMRDIGKKAINLVKCLFCIDCNDFVRAIPDRRNVSIMHCGHKCMQYFPPPPKPRLTQPV